MNDGWLLFGGVLVGLFVVAAAVCGMASSLALQRIVDEVNAKLPAEERFVPYGWYSSKYLRLRREYRRLYPAGTRFRRLRHLHAVMLGAFLLALLAAAVVLLAH